MTDSSLAFMAECIDCKEKITITPSNLKKEKYHFEGKQSMWLWLTHYDCPQCGRIHYCQISKILARVAKYKGKGQTIPRKLQSKYKNSSKDLTLLRNKLMKEYHNKWFEDSGGHTFKVEFVHD